jgi:hypothetical protein
MVITLPALSLNGLLPATPAAVASMGIAMLVLAGLLAAAVGFLFWSRGGTTRRRRRAPRTRRRHTGGAIRHVRARGFRGAYPPRARIATCRMAP